MQAAIKSWAESNDLWFECGFRPYLEHVGGEPSDPPVVTLLICGGDLVTVLAGEDPEGHEPAFRELLEKLGYFYENLNGYTMAIYTEVEPLCSAFIRYFHWRWVCSLITQDTADVYQELYGHFVRNPDDLNRLHWRDFETLLFRIFQNQGFSAELGPGTADNGVDLRLWQRDPIGDILTVVQAKRYAIGNKIDLTNVAALYGIGIGEGASKSLFVTTSSYLPGARRWAARFPNSIELAERKDVVNWCARATEGIIADKSSLVSPDSVARIIEDVAHRRDPRVLHAHSGYGAIMNNFALVIKETKHAAFPLQTRHPSTFAEWQNGLLRRGSRSHAPQRVQESVCHGEIAIQRLHYVRERSEVQLAVSEATGIGGPLRGTGHRPENDIGSAFANSATICVTAGIFEGALLGHCFSYSQNWTSGIVIGFGALVKFQTLSAGARVAMNFATWSFSSHCHFTRSRNVFRASLTATHTNASSDNMLSREDRSGM